ncbi:MAG: hypothetical protein LLG37_04660 [Spirochaetia bacterium]|nr:hypothetical protein [Spirochaetia bacterium]
MKKACGINSDLVIDYFYGELKDPAKAAFVAEHITACPECAAEIKELENVREGMKSIEVDLPEDGWNMHAQGVMRKLRRKYTAADRFNEHIRPFFEMKKIGFAMLVLVVAGAGIQFYNYRNNVTKEREIAEQMELLDNLEIIERIDFYEKMINS